MGQNFSSQKKKPTQKPNWRPEVLLTEVIDTSDYDPITIRKRKASEDIPRQSGPNKKDVNKAIKFVQEFLPLSINHEEANISVGTSPLMTMDIKTFSQDKALTDAKVQEQIKRVCNEGHKNSALAKELFNEQAGNMFKKFSFANQREEILQQQNKFFKVGSFGPAQSTPDISKYVEGNEKNKDAFRNAPDTPENGCDTPTMIPKVGGHDNEEAPERPSFYSNNSPEKKFGGHFGGDHNDISAISVDLTKKQSISFRIESKDQSKVSEEDIGFKSATQAQAKLAPIEEKAISDLPETVKPKPEMQDNILIHGDKPQQREVAPQEHKQNTVRGVTGEEKTKPTKNVSQQSRKEAIKSQVSQSTSSKQWPSSSPKVDRKDKRSKENIQTEKYQLVTKSKVASDKPSLKSSVHYENLGAQKRANGENYSSLNNLQRKRTEPLRQSNAFQENSQTYKTNKVEMNLMVRQDMNQGWPSSRQDVNYHERTNYQQAPVKKHLEATPNQQRTNKWLNDENKMSVQTSSPQFNTDVNPINVDLNLDELLRAADNGAVSYGYPNNIQQSMQPMQQMQQMHPMQPMYVNYADLRFSPNYAMAIPFQVGFQGQTNNIAGQYISPKHLDETAYYEENSQIGGRNNSMYLSRHDISQDLSDYSIDAGRGNQLNNSYMRRNKHRNAPQVYVHNHNRGGPQTDFH